MRSLSAQSFCTKSIFAGAFVLLLAAFASAQVPIPSSGNVYIGYSFENASASALNNIDRPNLQGWEASLEAKIVPFLGLVADVSGRYGSQNFTELTPNGPFSVSVTGHEYEALFGPRLSIPVGKLRPFAEVMVGVAHMGTSGGFPTDTSFATAVGGGFDYRLFRPIAWRVEGDYVRTTLFSASQNNVKITTGLVLRF